MIILTIRTDKPEAEIGLFNGNTKLVYKVWTAHRQLAETIHPKIKEILDQQGKDWHDLEGIVAFQGPGSFTGLRIGLSVANVLSQGLGIPIIARSDPKWLEIGLADLQIGQFGTVALPDYGAPVHITAPKH